MKEMSVIGVDVGGTKIHIARIENDTVVAELRIPTSASRCRDYIIKDLIDGISQLQTHDVIGIGIGVPGLVDEELGVIRNVLNIPAWRDFPIRKKLNESFLLPIYVGNDANCFALGEKYFGKAQNHKNLVALALGTGVGAGIIINNELYSGNNSIAGEFGGINYLESDYESYCSGKFFTQKYNTEAFLLAQKAAQNDKKALKIFDEFGRHVGNLIKAVLYSLGPDAIIIGGSLSNAYPYFKNGMLESFKTFPHKSALDSTLIDISGTPEIPVLGAGALVKSGINNFMN